MIAAQIFGKKLEKIELVDLVDFFSTGQVETAVLEFKSGDAGLPSILKEISAFLNTEGGLLIFGSPREITESAAKGGERVCRGPLVKSRLVKDKNSIYQSIATGIVPLPRGISIHEIADADGAVFLIEVPQSETAPHQITGEGRYYIRVGTSVVPAPHATVEALILKRHASLLIPDIVFSGNREVNECMLSVSNESRFPAERIRLVIEVFGVEDALAELLQFRKIPIGNRYGHSFVAGVQTEVALSRFVVLNCRFSVRPGASSYLLKITYWCDGMDTRFIFCVRDNDAGVSRILNPDIPEDIIDLQAFIGNPDEPLVLKTISVDNVPWSNIPAL